MIQPHQGRLKSHRTESWVSLPVLQHSSRPQFSPCRVLIRREPAVLASEGTNKFAEELDCNCDSGVQEPIEDGNHPPCSSHRPDRRARRPHDRAQGGCQWRVKVQHRTHNHYPAHRDESAHYSRNGYAFLHAKSLSSPVPVTKRHPGFDGLLSERVPLFGHPMVYAMQTSC